MKPQPLFSAIDRRKVVTIPQLAKLTGFPESSIRYWTARNEIPGAIRKGKGKRWYFKREDLERWWEEMHQTQST